MVAKNLPRRLCDNELAQVGDGRAPDKQMLRKILKLLSGLKKWTDNIKLKWVTGGVMV